MWDVLSVIFQFLIDQGGIWGILLSAAIIWIAVREIMYQKQVKENKEGAAKSEDILLEKDILANNLIIKERQEHQIKSLEEDSKKLLLIIEKTEQLNTALSNYHTHNLESIKNIQMLNDKIQSINNDRISELKDLLKNYNTVMTEISISLQKIKFVLKHNLDDY